MNLPIILIYVRANYYKFSYHSIMNFVLISNESSSFHEFIVLIYQPGTLKIVRCPGRTPEVMWWESIKQKFN